MAERLGDEVFPGQVMLDASGNRVASSTTMFPVIVAGGRAIDALRPITVAQHLFGLQNTVVAHHSHRGATTFTADGIIDAYKHEHHADISALYERGSICIGDYEASLKRDACAHSIACRDAKVCEHLRLFSIISTPACSPKS